MNALALSEDMLPIENEWVKKCSELLERGRDCVVEAAKIYCQQISSHEDLKEQLCDAGWNYTMQRRLDAIGRDHCIPELLYMGGNHKKLINCTIDEQRKYHAGAVEVLVDGGDILKVKIEDMTKLQVKQVFAKDHIRSISEQRAWQESGKIEIRHGSKAEAEAFVKAGRLIVPPHQKQLTFDRKTVFAFLAMME